MPQGFRTQRRVEFRDTDAAGIVHFSVFFAYMEEAEHAFWRHYGMSVFSYDDEGAITWPRVAARCDYQDRAHFEDVLDIDVRLVRLGEKSVTYEFSFTHEGRPVAAGEMTSVCCRLLGEGNMRSIKIPAAIRDKLPLVPPTATDRHG